jgi:hypothetical protein
MVTLMASSLPFSRGRATDCARCGVGRILLRCRLVSIRDALWGAGKAVRSRRDPVTVIGDETRTSH